MHFLFWHPSPSGIPPVPIQERLKALCPSGVAFIASDGPEGERGSLCFPADADLEWCKYDDSKQLWAQWQGLWYGVWEKHLPNPADHLKKRVLHRPVTAIVEIEGRRWEVPICANRATGECVLPYRSNLVMDEQGRVTEEKIRTQPWRDLASQYEAVQQGIWQTANNETPEDSWPHNTYMFPVSLIQTLYAVDLPMLNLMGFWYDQNPGVIMLAAMGMSDPFPVAPQEVCNGSDQD